MTTIATGVIEKIEFTQGSAGNQWTTIDGVRYATWWDARRNYGAPLRVGNAVDHHPTERKLWSNDVHPVPCTTIVAARMAGPVALRPAETANCRTDGCDGHHDNGEGWNGYCGNCADRMDADD